MMAMNRGILSFCLCLLSLCVQAAPGLLEGKVVRIVDGDSLWLEPAAPAAPVELRLEGIDAPEICQAWGPEAKKALAELVQGKEVSVKTVGRDTYGRTLGTLYLGEQNINKLMVQEGHAWSTRYKYDRGPYVADERMARALSRGFNREGGAVMPRDFRQLNGACPPPAARRRGGGAGRACRHAGTQAGRSGRGAAGGRRRRPALRRTKVLLADDFVRRSDLVPEELSRRPDGRQPRRRALRTAVVPAIVVQD